jgi:hypothetical protein
VIIGAHVIVYSDDAESDRAFFREVLEFDSVDAGHGWLIFALPPAELAVHPDGDRNRHDLYLMCDDLASQAEALRQKGIELSETQEERWGSILKVRLPSGSQLGLYQPKHPSPLRPGQH